MKKLYIPLLISICLVFMVRITYAQSISFSRANDSRIKIEDAGKMNFGTGSFSIEAIIKASPGDGYYMIFSKRGTSQTEGFFLSLDGYGSPTVQIDGANYFRATKNLRDNQCHHIGLRKTPDSVSIYVDGNLLNRAKLYGVHDVTSNASAYIGNDEADYFEHGFNGLIKEIRVWNIALSGQVFLDRKDRQLNQEERSSESLVGYWRLNESSGQTVKDFSKSDHVSYLGNATSDVRFDPSFSEDGCEISEDEESQTGNGLKFVKANTTRAIAPHNNKLDFGTGNFTIEATINTNVNATGYSMIVSTRTEITNGFFLSLTSSGRLIAQIESANYETTFNPELRDDKCHFIALKRQGDSLFFYVDNVVVQNLKMYNKGDIMNYGNVVIGNDAANGYRHGFEGFIRELRIWSVSRTSTDLEKYHNSELNGNETGLVAYWKLNDGAGQFCKDYSNSNNTVVLGSNDNVESVDPLWDDNSCAPPVVSGLQTFESSKVIVYPNPAENYVNINMSGSFKFEIINSTGSIVASGIGEENESINVSNLERGLYIIKINDSYNSRLATFLK
ncbi:MAG: T9SS type A sorting domain-containing protein [Sporocytophaga sp.]|nr:T9SS type A sorting domain-containing protein [Sporocytophaga sp.]